MWETARPVVEKYIAGTLGPKAIVRDFLKIAKVLRKFGPQLPKLLEDFIRWYKFDDKNWIQFNIDIEDCKSGCAGEELNDLVDEVKGYERLTLRGLMILPAKDDNTEAFARTKALFDDIKIKHPELEQWDTLSMGMSGDMVQAIQNGSTMVRVGSAIFGARA